MRYDHECPEHGVFEVYASVKETKSMWPCPECGKDSKKVILSSPGIVFKGGDWASKKPKKIDDPTGRDWKGKGEAYGTRGK